MGIKFLNWYLKIAFGGALIGGSMELFMIKTGFCIIVCEFGYQKVVCGYGVLSLLNLYFSYVVDEKVTVLESEKRAWENSPEAQAIKEALNPWRHHDALERKNS